MDYTALAATANTLIQNAGFSVKLTRAGANVGSGFAVFISSKSTYDEGGGSALLAQTEFTVKTMLFTGLAKEPLVGDFVFADKEFWTVTAVEKVRPSTVTLLYKLEVT